MKRGAPSGIKERGTKRRTIDETDLLLKAANNYIEARGGKLVVIGGIEIQEWPSDPQFCFRIAIKCLGRKPVRSNGPA